MTSVYYHLRHQLHSSTKKNEKIASGT